MFIRLLILILIAIPTLLTAEPTDVELFANVSRIRLTLKTNSRVKITENYYKRSIQLDVTNPPGNLTQQLLPYTDNLIDKIEVIRNRPGRKTYRINIGLINFFYDHRKVGNQLIIAIGQGQKIVPLKTNHNLVFIPYAFDSEPLDININKLNIKKLRSIHPVAQLYNKLIDLYLDTNYKKGIEIGEQLLLEKIDQNSRKTLEYLINEMKYYQSNNANDSCISPSLNFKNLMERYPNHPYNDRAAVFIYKCYVAIDASNDLNETLKHATKNYTNSPYYYTFLFASGIQDLSEQRFGDFRKKMYRVIRRTKDQKLKFHAIYKLYQHYFQKNDIAYAYNIILSHAKRAPKAVMGEPLFLVAYGDALFYQKQFKNALDIYQKILPLNQNQFIDRYVRMRIADLYLYQFQYDTAENYYKTNKQRFSGKDIGSALARIRMTELDGDFSDKEKTIADLNGILMMIKEDAVIQEILFRIAQIHFYTGDYSEAYFAINKLLSRYPESSLKTTASEMINRIIYAFYYDLYRDKNYLDIVQIYQNNSDIIKSHPEFYSLIFMITTSINQLDQYLELTQLIDQVLKRNQKIPYENIFLYHFANAYLKLKNFYKAQGAIRYLVFRARGIRKTYQYNLFKGNYYWEKEQFPRSIPHYNNAFAHEDLPQKERIYYLSRIARYFFHHRAYSPALNYYLKLYKIDHKPLQKKVLRRIARIYYYMAEYNKVIIVLKQYFEKFPDTTLNTEIRYRLGMSYIYENNFKKGESILKGLIKELEIWKKEKKATSDDLFWGEIAEKMLTYHQYKNKLDNLKELKVKRGRYDN